MVFWFPVPFKGEKEPASKASENHQTVTTCGKKDIRNNIKESQKY
jgi:hypothetical protein